MFARVILHKVKGRKNHVQAVVKRRLEMWERGEFPELLHELAVYDDWSRSQQTNDQSSFEDGRSKKVTEKIAAGELSKALQTHMSAEPYTGAMDKLELLHPARPQHPHLLPLPEIQPPATTPDNFYHAVCSAARATFCFPK